MTETKKQPLQETKFVQQTRRMLNLMETNLSCRVWTKDNRVYAARDTDDQTVLFEFDGTINGFTEAYEKWVQEDAPDDWIPF